MAAPAGFVMERGGYGLRREHPQRKHDESHDSPSFTGLRLTRIRPLRRLTRGAP